MKKNHYVPVKFGSNKTTTWDMDILRTQLGILSAMLTEMDVESDDDNEDVDHLWALVDALDDEVHTYFMRVDDEEDV